MIKQFVPHYIHDLYVMVTEFCPLRCKYCYVNGRENHEPINIEYVGKAINFFSHKPKVIFFGGEPLSALPKIKEIIQVYGDKMERFQVITSGLVNLDEFIDEVYIPSRDKFDLQISWDGVADNRVLPNGENTQAQVYNNIIKLLQRGIGFQIRCVINENNVANMFEIYKTFKELRHKFKICLGDFTIVHQSNIAIDEELERQLDKILKDISASENLFYIPQFLMQHITNVIIGKPAASCDVGNYLVLKRNGDIYPCTILSQLGKYKIGDVDSIDTEVIEALTIRPSECYACEYSCICDGGCRFERIANFGDGWEQEICKHTCMNMKGIYNSIYNWYHRLKDRTLINNFLYSQRMMWTDYQLMDYERSKVLQEKMRSCIKEG
jgi:uncharacterized protein